MKGGTLYKCDKPGTTIPNFAVSSKPKLADQMIEMARGGLFNLAYGPGNNSPGRSYRIAPPNLKDFMKPMLGPKNRNYYRAYYGYWLDNYTRKQRRGPMDIKAKNNCHYHYLNLKLIHDVLELTEKSTYLWSNRDLSDARHCLLYGRHPGTKYQAGACFVARKGLNNVRNVPLAEFYLSGRTSGLPYQVNDEHCTKPATEFMAGQSPARKWFDEKYSKSSF